MLRNLRWLNALRFIPPSLAGTAVLTGGISLFAAQPDHPLTLDPSGMPHTIALDAPDSSASQLSANNCQLSRPPLFLDVPASNASSTRHGFLDLLDSRSMYGKDWFPEPLLADESDVDNEFAASYFHAEKRHQQTDQAHVEIEKSFGLLTLEIGGGYETDRSVSFDPDSGTEDRERQEGFTNIELGARYPLLELVSADQMFDNTVVFGLELSPPTQSPISRDTEIVPKLFDMLRIGDHFSLQTGLGVSTLIGPDARGLATLEYDAVFGYRLTHEELPLPLVASTVPIFEIDGETTLNQESAGFDSLSGTLGFRVNFDFIGRIEPKLGLGYVFPIDAGARQEFHWGVVTSLILEY